MSACTSWLCCEIFHKRNPIITDKNSSLIQVLIDLVSREGNEQASRSCFPFWIVFCGSTQGIRIRFLANTAVQSENLFCHSPWSLLTVNYRHKSRSNSCHDSHFSWAHGTPYIQYYGRIQLHSLLRLFHLHFEDKPVINSHRALSEPCSFILSPWELWLSFLPTSLAIQFFLLFALLKVSTFS